MNDTFPAQDGALVTFEGVIRDHDHGASVTRLDYQAHPDAERFLRETCAEVARETGLRVAAAHRVGTLAIGEVALVASVAAPLTPPWPMPGRSWYPIDSLNTRDAAGITLAAEGLLRWLDAAADAAHVALLGFSQGAAVALQALRLAPERIDAVVVLSGYAAPGDLPNDAALQERRPPVFWGRGSRDDVIPPNLIDHTAQWLPSHAELSGRVYPGLTHSISEQELSDVDVFLSQWKDSLDA